MSKNKDEQIKYLIKELNRLTKLYDLGTPEVSDKIWDDMYFELVQLENETKIYYKDSPTQKINYEIKNELNKIKHSHLMLSLDKTKSINDVISFLGNHQHIAMAKMDGLTCSLTYKNGRLISAETRGNGEIGEDVLHNAIIIKNIPNKINYKEDLIVDGEIICDYDSFKEFESEYKNPRNFASGSIRLLDSKECEKRKLSFIAWDVIKGFSDNEFLSTRLIELQNIGFAIVPFYCKREVNESIDLIRQDCEDFYGYPIDGVVFKYDKVDEYKAAGRTDHHFKGGIAYKFYDEEYETILKDIEWTMGRTGQLTPVAVYEDIDIDGSICNRASLHNISIMKEQLYQPYKGEHIWIYKSNQIIPQISKHEWLANDYNPPINTFKIPSICPICGEKTSIHKDNDSEVLYCDNPQCEGKLINRLDHFFRKEGIKCKRNIKSNN